MGKRKHSTDSEAKRSKNPFILDDVEEVDEDYESDYDEGESVSGSSDVQAKRFKGKKDSESTKRKSGAGKAVGRELAAAIKETERREKDRQKRPVNIFAEMTVEQLQAYALEHYGDINEEEEDADDGEGIGSGDDDYSDDEDDTSCFIDDLADRGFNLWMVRCMKRRERVNVKKIKNRIKLLKKKGTLLPIANSFFHKAITGLFWVEAKNRKDLMEALRDCNVPCAEKNIKMVPQEELGATYCPRPRRSEEDVNIVNFQVGMSVSITQGEHVGRQGMVVDMDENVVTVIFTPDIEPFNIPRKDVKVQDDG